MQSFIFRNDLWNPSVELYENDHSVQLVILGEGDRIFTISEIQEELCRLCQCKGQTRDVAIHITLHWTPILQDALFCLKKIQTSNSIA